MDIELVSGLSGRKQALWAAFMQKMGLAADEAMESTCLVWEDEEIIATGSRQENILKCIAVDPFHQGEDLTATVLTVLRQDAFAAGHTADIGSALQMGVFHFTCPPSKWR